MLTSCSRSDAMSSLRIPWLVAASILFPFVAVVLVSGGGVQRLELALSGKPPERLGLELAHALRRQAEPAAGLAQGGGLIALEAEAKLDPLPFALGQLGDRALHRVFGQADLDLVRGPALLARKQVAELGAVILADGPLEARDRTRRLARLAHLVGRELRLRRDLLVGRLPAELD